MGSDGTKEPADEEEDEGGNDIAATNSPFCKSTSAVNRRWNSQRRVAKSASLMCSAGRNTCGCCLGVLGSAASELTFELVIVDVRVVPVATTMPALADVENESRVGVTG